MDFSQRVKLLREKSGLTQQGLADKMGLTNRAVGAWESGRSRPRLDKMQKLADLFDVSVADLMGEEVPEGAPPQAIPFTADSDTVPFVRLGKVHAGMSAEEIPNPECVVQVPRIVAEAHPRGFLLMVEGDCMDRAYPPGCLVLVDPELEPWNGCAVVAEVAPGEAVLRRYSRGQNSLMLYADSHSSYDDMIFTGEFAEVRLVGTVTWFQAACDESDPVGPF